ncbi:hypothetical protein CGGC5_v009487 [Colletotrichum fructicola Nara gc5]|uniref:DUF7580 domain-containing protein n=1 Tax=Colletotrichum fructicola (strain Nara gc5) TaxID=1213859 RepID=A0A7J6IZ73_COLFN|nr:hypothetical protein CGGC5_v009487 [Colletotrichum fructicola Nara gc5]
MVKFSSAEENGFQRVAGELKRWQLSASVTQNLGFILRDLRIIHDMFGSSQQAAVAQVKITAEYDTAFKNDVLKITSFRMQWEAACVALVKGLPDQQCRELMCGQGDWNSLKLQTMIQIKLADGFFSFEKSSSRLQKHVATMRSKLIIWDSMSVSSEEDFPEDDCSIFIDRWTSIQRGRSSKKYSELLRRISEDISDLSRKTGLWRDVAVVSFPTPESAAPQSPKLTTKKTRFDLSPNDLSKPLRSCSSEVEIFNLCDALTQDCGEGCCLGLLPHGEWHYHVHDTTCKDRELESVGDILPYKGGKNMTTIERRAIALALATGVLQLFDTPWLRDRWSINDIYVDKREQACLFVMMELDAPLKQDPTERKNHQSLLVHPNPRLFALAVALLELTYGAPLSSFREKGDGDDDFTELRIADRLTQRIKDPRIRRLRFEEAWGSQP